MPLPPATDPILETAVALFRRDGFDGVSIEEMVRETGVNRYALYQRFGGKKGLYLAALDSYYQARKKRSLALLADPDLGVMDALREAISLRVEEGGPWCGEGCLLINTAVELSGRDADIAARLMSYMREMKGAIEAAISRAKAEGAIPGRSDPAAMADIIFSLFLGAGVQARMGVPKDQIDNGLRAAFAQLSGN